MSPNVWARALRTVTVFRRLGILRSSARSSPTGRPWAFRCSAGKTSDRRESGGTTVASTPPILHYARHVSQDRNTRMTPLAAEEAALGAKPLTARQVVASLL